MSKKTTKTTKTKGDVVAYTLYFEGDDLVLKLAKRVPPWKYARVQGIVESVLDKVFGIGGYRHDAGTRENRIVHGTSDQADRVSASLSLHDDLLSLTYKRKVSSGQHDVALQSLSARVKILDDEIARWERSLASEEEGVANRKKELLEKRQERNALQVTISALK